MMQIRKYSDISGKIHLILDQASYHKCSKEVDKAKKLNINLHYLPPYSPNLNPIERLWNADSTMKCNSLRLPDPKNNFIRR